MIILIDYISMQPVVPGTYDLCMLDHAGPSIMDAVHVVP